MWPSRTIVSTRSCPTECVRAGHQLVSPSVNTRNATSGGRATVIVLRSVRSVTSMLLSFQFAFRCRLEGGQRLWPELVEIRAELGDRLGLDPVDASSADAALGDETGVLQHLEVLGDRGPADRKLTGQVTNRPGPVAEKH